MMRENAKIRGSENQPAVEIYVSSAPTNVVKRRKLIGVLAGTGTAVLAGCASDGDEPFEPDISETVRLGTAESISLDRKMELSTQSSKDFEEEATVRANVQVHDYIGADLGEQELIGAGVSLGIDYVSVDEIEDEVDEDEFERAKPLATVVNQRYVYDEGGDLVTQPDPVELDTLRSQLPRTVTVTVASESDEYTAVLPVVVHRY
ncbi:hypothetical protein [Halomontanus rarus]|uniref:hypothetical protein n=1 Tax=Halomontanus rarus TaxID=3034020 RepID=UPI0023E76461|nr:hypothetical protein [Halovivax sp. TS33]